MPRAADTLSPTTRMDRSAALAAGATSMSTNKSVLSARGIGKTVKSGEKDLVILRDIDLDVTQREADARRRAPGPRQSNPLSMLPRPDAATSRAVLLDGCNN